MCLEAYDLLLADINNFCTFLVSFVTFLFSDVQLMKQFPCSHLKQNTIYNVWRNTSNLRDAVNLRRIMVQRHRQELKLYGILQEQVSST